MQESMYNKDRDWIVELLMLGRSAHRITENHVRYGHHTSLSYDIATRKLNETVHRSAERNVVPVPVEQR